MLKRTPNTSRSRRRAKRCGFQCPDSGELLVVAWDGRRFRVEVDCEEPTLDATIAFRQSFSSWIPASTIEEIAELTDIPLDDLYSLEYD